MPKQRTETYVCDKCGETKHSPSYEQGKNWWQVEAVNYSSGQDSWLLCRGCIDNFKRWLKGAPDMQGGQGPQEGPYR